MIRFLQRLEVVDLTILDHKVVEHFERVPSVHDALQCVVRAFSITQEGEAMNLLPGNKDRVLECVIEGMGQAVIAEVVRWLLKPEGVLQKFRQNLSLVPLSPVIY
jgi:hypothetical protein